MFKKLFSKSQKPTDVEEKKVYQERKPRIGTPITSRIQFVDHLNNELSINNLSGSGMAFESQTPLNETLKGIVRFEAHTIPLTLELSRKDKNIFGYRISENASGLEAFLIQHFNPELKAGGLNPIDPQYLRKDGPGDPYWFKGRENSEIYFLVNDSKVIRFMLSIPPHTVEWSGDSSKRPQLNELIKDQKSYGSWIPKSCEWSTEIRETFARFIKSANLVPQNHRDQIEAVLQKVMP